MGYIQDMRKMIGHERLMIAGAGVYLIKDNQVLLQRRKDNGCWSDHGGCIEIGEEVEEAAKRELFEETGLIANQLELLGVFSGADTVYTYPNGDKAFLIQHSYVCSDFSGELKIQESEVTELKWFDMDNLPENFSSPVKRSLLALVEKYGRK